MLNSIFASVVDKLMSCFYDNSGRKLGRTHLHQLQQVPEHVIVLQGLQFPDSHGANLSIREMAVQQLHGQAHIQPAEGENSQSAGG